MTNAGVPSIRPHGIGTAGARPGYSTAAGNSVAYPGLGGTQGTGEFGGSRTFHGDLDCDGDIDFDDFEPFVQRLSEHCCWEECGACPQGGEPMGAQQLAAGMLAHVSPQHHALLRSMVADVAARNQGARRAYWLAVRQYLEQ